MKILIAGTWSQPMYEKSIADAFVSQGHKVEKFSWTKYFSSIVGKVEEKYSINGIKTRKFNKDLISSTKYIKPDLLLIWHGIRVLPSTLKELRKLNALNIASYNHDDFTGPISGAPIPFHHKWFWGNFLRCAPLYDHHFVKRQSNFTKNYLNSSKNNPPGRGSAPGGAAEGGAIVLGVCFDCF